MWRDGEQFRFASMTNLPRCGRLSVRQHRSVSCWIGPGGAARTAPDGTMKADNPKASAAFTAASFGMWVGTSPSNSNEIKVVGLAVAVRRLIQDL